METQDKITEINDLLSKLVDTINEAGFDHEINVRVSDCGEEVASIYEYKQEWSESWNNSGC